MSENMRIFSLLLILIYFYILIHFLKKKKIALKYCLLWLFSGFVMLVWVIFPRLLICLTNFLGIEIASNGLFGICLFLIIMLLVSITVIVSDLSNKNKRLIQEIAILNNEIDGINKRLRGKNESK